MFIGDQAAIAVYNIEDIDRFCAESLHSCRLYVKTTFAKSSANPPQKPRTVMSPDFYHGRPGGRVIHERHPGRRHGHPRGPQRARPTGQPLLYIQPPGEHQPQIGL